jgi:hypothetical protein
MWTRMSPSWITRPPGAAGPSAPSAPYAKPPW